MHRFIQAPLKPTLFAPSFALAGYAGHGKDTLIRDTKTRKLRLQLVATTNVCSITDSSWSSSSGSGATSSNSCGMENEAKWIVYSSPMNSNTNDLLTLFDSDRAMDIQRYAFADALKVETHEWLGFRDCPAHAFENVKNTLLVPHPTIPYCLKTIRGHYIDYGQERRKLDPQIWAKKVVQQIVADKSIRPQTIDIISDFRFDNELLSRQYQIEGVNHDQSAESDISTIRVHRAGVPVAAPLEDRSIDSEHNLDDFATKYLFIPPGITELGLALKRFPQYAKYEPLFYVFNNC